MSVSNTRATGETDDVRFAGPLTPDPTAPLTWRTCVTEGCATRVHPRDRNNRCPEHRSGDAVALELERARAIVDASRRAAADVAYRRRVPA